MKTFVLGLVVVAGIMSSCSPKAKEETTLSGLNPKKFQAEIDGKQAGLYTLKNSAGMEVCITNFGGRIVSVLVPDKHGNRKDVVLGFDSLADYRNIPSDFGASIGRYANRIAQGRIEIDGETIQLPQNNYGHCLHGGPEGGNIRCMKLIRSMVRLSNDPFFSGWRSEFPWECTGESALSSYR